jgi:rod shape-determining protein MreD
MTERTPRAFIAATLAVALVLQLLELPYALAMLRPLFVPLVLVYWAMVVPQPGGLLTAWFAGLLLDVLLGTALGQHALGLTVLVFITLRLRGWLTLFPIWQEAAVLTAFWFVYAFLMFWIDGATGHRADPWLHWVPVLSSGLCWPMVFAGLNRLRRRALRDPLTL